MPLYAKMLMQKNAIRSLGDVNPVRPAFAKASAFAKATSDETARQADGATAFARLLAKPLEVG